MNVMGNKSNVCLWITGLPGSGKNNVVAFAVAEATVFTEQTICAPK